MQLRLRVIRTEVIEPNSDVGAVVTVLHLVPVDLAGQPRFRGGIRLEIVGEHELRRLKEGQEIAGELARARKR